MNPEAPQFCTDDDLGYLRSRTTFEAGQGLRLDPSYCLAHLPLVAPGHPRAITAREGTHYQDGRHPEAFSLVMPLDGVALRSSEAFLEFASELKAAPFADKIAWPVVEQRWTKLHATVCGSLGVEVVPHFDRGQFNALAEVGPVHVEIRGAFSGNVNIGRLYLRVYPERRRGENTFHQIQRAFGRTLTDLFVVGLYNLTDDLDAGEAAALGALLQRWWQRTFLRVQVSELWLLGAVDDLVLESRVVRIIPLSR